MQSTNTAENSIINRALELERLKNSYLTSWTRIALVSLFFLLHLFMGWVVGAETFRNKELLFSSYLFVSLLFLLVAKKQQKFASLSAFSVALFDIPMVTLILEAWLPTISQVGTIVGLGMLCLSFMIFMIALTSLYFSGRIILVTAVSANVSALLLFNDARVAFHTQIVGLTLLNFTALFVHVLGQKIRKLLLRITREQARTEKLSRYFAPSVAKLIISESVLKNYEAAEYDITVLFVDLRHFTKMTSTMSSAAIVKMLNEVHEHLVDCIFKTGGTLDKYLGDGLMAYFGAPVLNENHADKALECALLMRSRISELNELRAKRGEEPIALGMGIHSGRATVGDVGAEVRREFTAIGDTVNVASRIESLTKKHATDTILSEETRLRLKGQFALTDLGTETVRGKAASIQIHALQ